VVKGRLNLMVGEEDAGKSTLQAWVAACLTRGELPGEHRDQPANVLFVGADEDDWNEMVVPRLHAAGADLDHVREFCGKRDTAVFNVVDHVEALNDVLIERTYALVVFEQMMDVLPPMKNANDPVALRSALRPLRAVLRAREVPGLGTLHVNKAEAATLRQKMQGSMQFGALSRSTVLVARHPEDEDRRVAVLGKANYVRPDESRALTFTIESSGFPLNGQDFDVGRVANVELDVDLRIGDVLHRPTERDLEREERAERLADALTETPQTIRALADATDIPKSTVQRLLDDILLPEQRAERVAGGWVSRDPSPIGGADVGQGQDNGGPEVDQEYLPLDLEEA
jgi:AAA domain/IclR helix-turn-helix domain